VTRQAQRSTNHDKSGESAERLPAPSCRWFWRKSRKELFQDPGWRSGSTLRNFGQRQSQSDHFCEFENNNTFFL